MYSETFETLFLKIENHPSVTNVQFEGAMRPFKYPEGQFNAFPSLFATLVNTI